MNCVSNFRYSRTVKMYICLDVSILILSVQCLSCVQSIVIGTGD